MPTEWKFYREQTGQFESVPRERIAWEAHYCNGTILKQFDDSGVYHQFGEIDQTKLTAFRMVTTGSPGPMWTLKWEPGYKLIHFYRMVRLDFGTPNERLIKLYCFGYETPSNHKMILVVGPDNQTFVVDDVNKINVR